MADPREPMTARYPVNTGTAGKQGTGIDLDEGTVPMSGEPRVMQELSKAEALRRLSSVPFGRVVFSRGALPAIRPVNHLVDDGQVIIGSDEGDAIVGGAGAWRGTVLAYEADDLDHAARAGWSVVVTGLARLVDDSREAARYREALRPWLAGEMGHVIRIDTEIVTGFELRAVDRLLSSNGPGRATARSSGFGTWR